ncbi:ABC transporter permease, partial [Mycobacterium tuberculosis]
MMSRFGLNERNARFWQLALLAVILVAWHLASRNQQFAFFLGEPIQVAGRIWSWFLP